MDIDELRVMLDRHQQWLETDGREGARFDLSGQTLDEISTRRIWQERASLYWQRLGSLREALRSCKLSPEEYRQEENRFYRNRGVNLARANFNGARIKQATLINCNFSEADFTNADLAGADLRGSNFSHARLTDCNLEAANLDHPVDLICEQLLSARINRDTVLANTFRINWISASEYECACLLYPGSDLSHKVFRGRNLSFLDLQGASLRDCDLMEAVFIETNLAGADFRSSRFHKTQFVRSDLRGANFSGTRLIGGTLEGARLEGADFRGAELRIGEDGLAPEQVRSAIIDEKTILMDHIRAALGRD